MTTLTERIPLDRIEQRARHARPGRTVLAVIALVLFGLGWLAFKAVRGRVAGAGVVRLGGH